MGSSTLPLANMDDKDFADMVKLLGCGFACGLGIIALLATAVAAVSLVIRWFWF